MRRGCSILVSLVVVAACTGEADTTTTSDAPTSTSDVATTAASTTVTSEAPTTTAGSTDPTWDDLPNWSGFQWGDIRTNDFEPAFRLVVPEGMAKLCDESPDLIDFTPSLDAADSGLEVMRLDLGTVEDTAAALAEGQTNVTPIEPTTVGGAEGVTLTFDTSISEGFQQILATPTCEIGFFPNETWRLAIVDVGGEVVTFAFYAPTEKFESVAAEFQPMIDSVIWKATED